MKIMKRACISLSVILVLLVATEIGFRLVKGSIPPDDDAGTPFCIPDKVLGYRFRPGAVAPQGKEVNCINQLGFRGEEIALPKPSNVYRILCVGDSATNGVNVHNAETYPGILGEMFKNTVFKNDVRVEVINAGFPGYLSDQHRYLIDQKYIALDPDMIIFMMGVTDISSILLTNKDWDAIRNIKRDDRLLPEWMDVFLKKHSSAYFFGTKQARDYIDEYRLEKDNKRNLEDRIKRELANYKKNYQSMIDACKKNGIIVVNVNFPWNFTARVGREDNYTPLKHTIKYYEFNLYWQAMPLLSQENQEIASRNEIVNIDVQPDVLNAKDRLLFYGKYDFSHPNVNGNFLIASRIYSTILEKFFSDNVRRECSGLKLADKYLLGLEPDQ